MGEVVEIALGIVEIVDDGPEGWCFAWDLMTVLGLSCSANAFG